MEDGREVIAKIPRPNAGPPYYTTSFEMAILELGMLLTLISPFVYLNSSSEGISRGIGRGKPRGSWIHQPGKSERCSVIREIEFYPRDRSFRYKII